VGLEVLGEVDDALGEDRDLDLGRTGVAGLGGIFSDERLLALPMVVGSTGTIGVMPVEGGTFTPVIDFGDRAMLIARQVAWAPDGASIYAAVADMNADIVLLDGLI